MAYIRITNFSCIEQADVELKPLTLLIGPQASGKSVISKLIHFFYQSILDIGSQEYPPVFKEVPLESHANSILKNFEKRFLPQAWGPSKFELEFSAGPIGITISRTKPRRTSNGKLHIDFSEFYQSVYSSTQDRLGAAREKSLGGKADDPLPAAWDLAWNVTRAARTELRNALADEWVDGQLFIPAGRSFFTSIGKAIIAFEHAGFLDPLTIRFGNFFLAMRERLAGRAFIYTSERAQKARRELQGLQDRLSEDLFCGKIKVDNDNEYIESPDGRKIPFSIMSSGQQELLPLWLTVNQFFDGDAANHFVYIEEPEAHLFPATQGILMEYLVTLLATSPSQKMLITTHSPYILSKINNLLKAGMLASRGTKSVQAQVEKIVPKSAWLEPRNATAYAIKDRQVFCIVGEDGLIDSEYLDDVSNDMAQTYNELLEIEYKK
jgi:hypothetical protein